LLVDLIILGHDYVVVKPYNTLIIFSEAVGFTGLHFLMKCVSYLHHFFVHQLSFAGGLTQASSDLKFHVELFLGSNSLFLGIT
jgi:hypothetical protein